MEGKTSIGRRRSSSRSYIASADGSRKSSRIPIGQEFATSTVLIPKEAELLSWKNEVSPSTHRCLKVAPDRLVGPLLDKRIKEEVHVDDLDKSQFRVLRNDRLARVYLNTLGLSNQKPRQKSAARESLTEMAREQLLYAHEEREHVFNKREDDLEALHDIYSIPFRRLNRDINGKLPFCQRAETYSPYSGPYGLTKPPCSSIPGPMKTKYFQITPSDLKAYKLPASTAKLSRKYSTTSHAAWREYRSKHPDQALSYSDFLKHIKAAQLKAVSHAIKENPHLQQMAIKNSKIWSTRDPLINVVDNADVRSERESEEEKETKMKKGARTREEEQMERGKEDSEEEARREWEEMTKEVKLMTRLSKKPEFEMDEGCVEDLMKITGKLREEIVPYFAPQPLGKTRKHPKNTAKYKELKARERRMFARHKAERSRLVKLRKKKKPLVGKKGAEIEQVAEEKKKGKGRETTE